MTGVYPLRLLGLGLDHSDGIIPAAVANQMAEAEAILARARAEAEAILAGATAARDEERRLGLAEGRAEAQAEAADWMRTARADLDQRLDRIQTEMSDLVAACVRRIIHSFDDRTLALETVRSALSAQRSEKRLQLYVAPSVEAAVRAELPKLMEDYPEIQVIDVIGDPGLSSSDVRLESELGVVSFFLDDTLADLGRLLRGV
jgi:type III secretion protein L